MPRRTAEANRAVLEAWERERKLVSEGQGTRNWTPEQQRDILDPERGKAYDEDGKAFEGQHMKSVEKYPEYQGDPENIQFLTKKEHFEAHKGNWQNPTNWYYDSVTKQFADFGEGRFLPCKILELDDPIAGIENSDKRTMIDMVGQAEGEAPSRTMSTEEIHSATIVDLSRCTSEADLQDNNVSQETVSDGIKHILNTVKEFSDKHPVVTAIVEVGLGVAAAYGTGKAMGSISKTISHRRAGHSSLRGQTIKAVAETVVNAAGSFDFKKTESFLKELGYTVSKRMNLSDSDRQRILQNLISSGKMSKEAVCTYLEKNINLHKNQGTFTEAVSKWIADLSYVRDGL